MVLHQNLRDVSSPHLFNPSAASEQPLFLNRPINCQHYIKQGSKPGNEPDLLIAVEDLESLSTRNG
jgi:hypothetical protein